MNECILGYKSAMAQARRMLSEGIITEAEYAIIDTMMAEKYGLWAKGLAFHRPVP